MNFPLFIAKKIYNGEGDGQKVSRPAIRIATVGVALGLAVMLVAVAVVLGFKHTIRDKVVGFGSDITVANFFTLQTSDVKPIQLNDSMMTAFLARNIIEGNIPEFSSKKSGNKILVSKTMSDKLNLHAGSKVYGYFMLDNDVRMRKYTVSGVYQTNLSKYDETMCFADLYSVVKLNGWENDQATGAELSIKDYNQLNEVLRSVTKKVNKHLDTYGETYCSATVEELNPQIFSWLELLDLNVWIILALMVCVTGFTMISGLLIIILERVQMIGVLKALGARNGMVRHTFMWFAVFIIGKGMIIGNILGIGICLIQYYTGIVKLDPTIYYVAEAPVEINIPLFLLVNIATLLVSVLILIVPSFLASNIRPAQSMRYE